MQIKIGRFFLSMGRPDPKADSKLARGGWCFLMAFSFGKRSFNLGYRSNAKPLKYAKESGSTGGLSSVWQTTWRWGRWYFVILTNLKD